MDIRSIADRQPRRVVPGRLAAVGVLLAAVVGLAPAARSANDLGRDDEPIVLRGSDAPALAGVDPSRVVAYRRQAGSWIRVPVQIDERVATTFRQIYGNPDSLPWPDGGLDFPITTYADPGTHVGADPDPTVDDDDEIVVLAGDAGRESAPSGSFPGGTRSDVRVTIGLSLPGGAAQAYVYLFVAADPPPAFPAVPPVAYDFRLLGGPYLDGYGIQNGPNPEDSTITAAAYTVHFSDRWIRDGTSVTAGSSSGVDVLDRHKALFQPGDCTRTETTFSNGEGAFIVNRSGPVRALRGYIGANSGVTTHRIHAFYAAREEIRTFLRVHSISGILDVFDYAPAAVGMTYRSDRIPGGVPVDGEPDAVPPGRTAWETVSGPQGSIAHAIRIDTDIPGFFDADVTSYHSDDSTPTVHQCTGDDAEYATSGLWVSKSIPNTDPAVGDAYRFVGRRAIRYGAPSESITLAEALVASVDTPLDVAVSSSGSGSTDECADLDDDGFVDCATGCLPPPGSACGDCGEGDAGTYPGAAEVCDAVDRDCNGAVDDPPCSTYDLDGSGRVDGGDLTYLGRAFGLPGADPSATWWAPADVDGDGDVDGDDLALLGAVWATRCGPGGTLQCP